MPRQARLDSPGTLHHVILRGIEKRRIVDDRRDREAFVERMGKTALDTGTSIYAWALMPNHAHILLRSGTIGLPAFMRRFLTGYAQSYNRRHERYGHVFQNRYKSIVCDEDEYFLQLVRYIHLNPLRAGLVDGVDQLVRYRWCGHAVLMGKVHHTWQDRAYVLSWFASTEQDAVDAYSSFVAEGQEMGRQPHLVGGGLIRSLGGWSEVLSMRRRKGRMLSDERILGRGAFVEQVIAEAEERARAPLSLGNRIQEARRYIEATCTKQDASVEELRSGSRRREISRLRSEMAVYLVSKLGLSMAETARQLGVSTSGIAKALGKSSER